MTRNLNMEKKQIIDGVTVVYTGNKHYTYKGLDHVYIFDNVDEFISLDRSAENYDEVARKNGFIAEEDVEMFDSNGNKLFRNCNSIDAAHDLVIELAEKGIDAVVGPKGPWYGPDGKMVPNESETAVGVYIVSTPDKSDDNNIHIAM